jgi:hypothetical protein
MSYVMLGVAGTTAVVSGVKAISAHKKKKKAKRAMGQLRKPQYQIPQELYDQLDEAEKRMVEGMPAEQKAEYVKNIERTRAATLKAGQDRKSGLLGLQAQSSQASDQYSRLVSMDAQARKQAEAEKRADISAARANLAAGKDKQQSLARDDYQRELQSLQSEYAAADIAQEQATQQMMSAGMGAAGSMYGKGGGNKGGGQFGGGFGGGQQGRVGSTGGGLDNYNAGSSMNTTFQRGLSGSSGTGGFGNAGGYEFGRSTRFN